MALLFPEPQYAIATVYIPDRRKMGSCRDSETKQNLSVPSVCTDNQRWVKQTVKFSQSLFPFYSMQILKQQTIRD